MSAADNGKRFQIGRVQKLSGMGWSLHERLLKLEGNILCYYSAVPKDFSGKPKEEIEIDNATCLEVTDKDKKKKLVPDRSFKVVFDSNSVVGAKHKDKPKQETWWFLAETTADRDLWIAKITPPPAPPLAKAEDVKPPQIEEKKAPPPAKEQAPQSFLAPIPECKEELKRATDPNVNLPKEEKLFLEQLHNIKEENKELEGLHSETRKIGINLDPEDKGLRDNIEEIHKYQQLLIEKKQKIEARAWDLKFQKYWGLITTADNNYDESVKYSEHLVDHVGKFRRTATFYTQLIINELHKPPEKRMFRPLEKIERHARLFCDDDPNPTVYVFNNMLFKITARGSMIIRGDEREYKWKAYGREFLSVDVLFDALFTLNKPKAEHNLRVPLSCLVDYKGFRAIVYGVVPLTEGLDPILGLGEDGIYHEKSTHWVTKQMPYVADVLNLGVYNFFFKNDTEPTRVAISPLMEVHRRDNTKASVEDEDAEEFAEKRKEMDFHIYELDYDEDVYYVLKTSEIFPVDVPMQGKAGHYACLRPEFVYKFDRPLRPDVQKQRIQALSQFAEYENKEESAGDVVEAKRKLLNNVIPRVVEQLDSLNVIPIDSATLTQVFHSEGLNMRYLGAVAEISILSQVKDICITEMLARTLKNVLHEELAKKVLRFAESPTKGYELFEKRELYAGRVEKCRRYKDASDNYVLVTQAEKEKYDELVTEPMHGYILEDVCDFMNMTFGKDKDTDEFWERILFPAAAEAFGYPVEKFNKAKTNLNALLFAFVYHFGVEMDFDASFELGKGEKPFTKQIRDLAGKSKVYGLRKIPYRVIAEKYKEYRNESKNDVALRSLKMKLAITKFLDDKTDVTALSEVAEILLEEGLPDKAIEKANEGLKLLHPLHAETIKFFCTLMRAYYEKDMVQEADKYCFKAISALDFHWGQYHPLHSTIYSILAYLIIKYKDSLEQAQGLYKACLISCTRVLGPNHLHTAEVYMNFGRLYLRMNDKEQALENIEKAYLIYDAAIETAIEKNYGLLANAALQLGTIIESQRRFKEALPYARKAAELYLALNGNANEVYITSVWLVICVGYSLAMDEVVHESCVRLIEALDAREKAKQRNLAQDIAMEKMKVNCVAATILVATRNLGKEDKRRLLKLAEEIYTEWAQEKEGAEGEQHEPAFTPVDSIMNRVITLSSLEFDAKGAKFLTQLYADAKGPGLFQFYRDLVDSLCRGYSQTTDSSTPAKENVQSNEYAKC